MYERALAHGGQKKATDSLELELQEVGSHPVWALGTKRGSFAIVTSVLNS